MAKTNHYRRIVMSSRSQRNFQKKNAHITAIVVGIILAVLGLYFIFGLADTTTGLVMTLVGAVFVVLGYFMKRSKNN